jgi:hypothetical protein
MTKLFNKAWKYFAGVTTVLAYSAWYDQIKIPQIKKVNKYFKNFEEGNISADSESSINLYNKYKEQIDSTFNKANKKAKEIVDILDNTKEKFMDDNPIFNIIKDFKEYLASFSAMDLCLIINITSCVFIFDLYYKYIICHFRKLFNR